MGNKEYIERGEAILAVTRDGCTANVVGTLFNMPAVDVVSKGVYEQVQWERDMAMQQLEEHGIPFGGEADVVEVRHGEWIHHETEDEDWGGTYHKWTCSCCGYSTGDNPCEANYCPNCGAKMDGGKEQT